MRRYPNILLSSAAVTSVLPLAFGLAPIHQPPAPAVSAKAPAAVVLISAAAAAPAVIDSYVPEVPLPFVFELMPSARPRDPRDTDQILSPIVGKVISGFGYRDGGRHDGIDIKGAERAPITASFPGRVIQAGSAGDGYGISVTLDLGSGVTALYAHLSSYSVRIGDELVAGQQLGVQGQTGRATTTHLHYEVRINGRAVNPAPYLH